MVLENLKIRDTIQTDSSYFTRWLTDEKILKWFPMCNKIEIEDAVKICMEYMDQKAIITAEIGDKPVGIACFYLQAFKKLSHQSLFVIVVDPDYRGKKIGTALIEELFKRGKERFNLKVLHLEVYKGNPAEKLYERLGFKKVGEHKKFLKNLDGTYEDKIFMQKKL